tara:strand:- start:109 stop:1347 length:1239 start_codon:yes stop_codon:yes gene_type:complete
MTKTNLKNHFLSFSKGWEQYIEECINQSSGNSIYYISDHEIYRLFFENIVPELQSLVDKRLYLANASIGKSGLAGIPWLAVFDKEITQTTQEQYYISYLFSRNAKKLHLSIAIGATQFTELYGDNNKTTKKISAAKDNFVNNFEKFAPARDFKKMDLLAESDTNFIRKFSSSITRRADHYEAGSFFTKTYDLVNPDFDEDDIVNDLKNYIDCYRQIVLDPISDVLMETLDETVFEDDDKKKNNDLNYDLPQFNPLILQPALKGKTKKKIKNSKPKKPSLPSKKVGDAGEKYVFEYEKNKLIKIGRNDLADLIVKQYEDLSFFPGYDIQSFDENGNKIFIEVKSTKGKNKNYFEISENEINTAKEFGNSYFIYQVTSALTEPKISTVINNLQSYKDQDKVLIEPMMHRVTFKE